MARYAKWENLESLMENNDTALKAIAAKHPDLVTKWTILRKRMGRGCPMARGCLKIIVLYEADNDKFIRSTETGIWEQ